MMIMMMLLLREIFCHHCDHASVSALTNY